MNALPPITNDDEHAERIAELTALLERAYDPPPESDQGQRLQALAIVIEAYEKIRWPIPSDLQGS